VQENVNLWLNKGEALNVFSKKDWIYFKNGKRQTGSKLIYYQSLIGSDIRHFIRREK